MDIIVNYGMLFVLIVVVVGFFMVYGIGVNDVVNVMGIFVGLKVFIIK